MSSNLHWQKNLPFIYVMPYVQNKSDQKKVEWFFSSFLNSAFCFVYVKEDCVHVVLHTRTEKYKKKIISHGEHVQLFFFFHNFLLALSL